MCLTLRNKSKIRIAKKDITVYKVLCVECSRIRNLDSSPIVPRSPYSFAGDFKWEVNQIKESKIGIGNLSGTIHEFDKSKIKESTTISEFFGNYYKDFNSIQAHQGLHAYTGKLRAKSNVWVFNSNSKKHKVFKMIIPKGSVYLKNWMAGEIVATQMKMVKRIQK